MARKCTCTTVPAAQSLCCRAATAGYANRPFALPTSRGTRCAQCDVITRRNGKPGFHFHFAKSSQCPGTAAAGCPALTGGPIAAGQMALLPGSSGALPF
jgi:hypothetical protein